MSFFAEVLPAFTDAASVGEFKKFLSAMQSFLPFFDRMGSMFKIVKSDIGGNVDKLIAGTASFPADIAFGAVIDADIAAVNNANPIGNPPPPPPTHPPILSSRCDSGVCFFVYFLRFDRHFSVYNRLNLTLFFRIECRVFVVAQTRNGVHHVSTRRYTHHNTPHPRLTMLHALLVFQNSPVQSPLTLPLKVAPFQDLRIEKRRQTMCAGSLRGTVSFSVFSSSLSGIP
jgi:hypothetical protein